jgi:group I intron endonuclease
MLPGMINFRYVPGNEPLARAGVYMIQNRVNGKRYFGISNNVKRRAKGHLSRFSSCTKLKNALSRYGADEFNFIPLCYSSDESDVECLLPLEAKLIEHYETTGLGGYNIRQGGDRDSPFCGDIPEAKERHSATHRATWAKPEFREKMREIQSTTEFKKQASEASRSFWSDSERAANHVEKMRDIWSSPDYKAAQSARQKEACKRPEVLARKVAAGVRRYGDPAERAKTAEQISNLIWITDGVTTTRIFKDADIPEGWRRGRLPKSEESKRRVSESGKLAWAKRKAAQPANDNQPVAVAEAA